MSVPKDNAITDYSSIESAKWTRYLPEAFGIRKTVQESKYRWCFREAALWGVATGTTMSLHRLRMKSSTYVAVNAGFLTFFMVYAGSYYFCFKRRDHRERMIELMMKLNAFDHAMNMPEPVPLDKNHPFVEPVTGHEKVVPEKQYVAHLPERKEWQKPVPTQGADQVFQEVPSSRKP